MVCKLFSDAVEVWDKYWQAIFVCLKPKIYQKYTDEVERRYAYWLLKCYPQFAELRKKLFLKLS